MKNKVIFIVLFLFLVVTAFFWFQVLRIKDLPLVKSSSRPVVSGEEAEAFISLAQELLIDYREPMTGLSGRDPFVREVPVDQPKIVKKPSDRFVLSSIIHSNSHALAVVNGKILAEGDTIYDQETKSEFMIGNIEIDRVEIIAIASSEKKYTLETKHGVGENK